MTEAELCERFAERQLKAGWICYAETGGWDMVFVRDVQVGVEAKLRCNVDVLSQAIGSEAGPGPDWHAVLVPKATRNFRAVAWELRLIVLTPETYLERVLGVWAQRSHSRPIDLPEIVPDVPAGVPAPRQLTPWKIKAIRLCLVLRHKGFVTVRDFRALGVDPSRWRHRWLRPDGRDGRATKWVPIDGVELPDEQHPDVAAQLREAS